MENSEGKGEILARPTQQILVKTERCSDEHTSPKVRAQLRRGFKGPGLEFVEEGFLSPIQIFLAPFAFSDGHAASSGP